MSPATAALTVSELQDLSAHTGYASVADVLVDAAPAIVWPIVLDIGSWIQDFHFEHVSGPVGDVGEVKHLWPDGAEGVASARERLPETATVMKTLSIVRNHMWFGVTPLKLANGRASSASNIILLDDLGNRTRVIAIRSKEFLVPNQVVADDVTSRSQAYQPIAQARWTEKYLPRLKALAEQSMAQIAK